MMGYLKKKMRHLNCNQINYNLLEDSLNNVFMSQIVIAYTGDDYRGGKT